MLTNGKSPVVAQWIERPPGVRKFVGSNPVMNFFSEYCWFEKERRQKFELERHEKRRIRN